jgi:hypothetical protein
MTGEVRDEPNLSTAEIVNPATKYKYDDSPVSDGEVMDNAGSEPRHAANGSTQLFPDNELNDFRAHWDKAQLGFVDEPRTAVEEADSLVATVVKRISEQFAAERAELEHQWDRGDNVSTEDLRRVLQRYRSFFDRLLTF